MELIEPRTAFAEAASELEKQAGSQGPESFLDVYSHEVTSHHVYEAHKEAYIAANNSIKFSLKLKQTTNVPLKISVTYGVDGGFATLNWNLYGVGKRSGKLVSFAQYHQRVIAFLKSGPTLTFRAKSGLDAHDDLASAISEKFGEFILVERTLSLDNGDDDAPEEVPDLSLGEVAGSPNVASGDGLSLNQALIHEEYVIPLEFGQVSSRLVSDRSITIGNLPENPDVILPSLEALELEDARETHDLHAGSSLVDGSSVDDEKQIDWLALGRERYVKDKLHQRLWDLYELTVNRLTVFGSLIHKTAGGDSGAISNSLVPSIFILTDAKHLIETQFEDIVTKSDGQALLYLHPLSAAGVSGPELGTVIKETVYLSDHQTRNLIVLEHPRGFGLLVGVAYKEATKSIELHKGAIYAGESNKKAKDLVTDIGNDLLKEFASLGELHRATLTNVDPQSEPGTLGKAVSKEAKIESKSRLEIEPAGPTSGPAPAVYPGLGLDVGMGLGGGPNELKLPISQNVNIRAPVAGATNVRLGLAPQKTASGKKNHKFAPAPSQTAFSRRPEKMDFKSPRESLVDESESELQTERVSRSVSMAIPPRGSVYRRR